MDEMKEALDKAAASADPAVRLMAIRYRELQQEFGQYDAFFAIYKQGVSLNGSGKRSVPTPTRAPTAKAMLTPGPRSSKADNFSTALQELIMEYGQPMKLNEVYSTYQQKHPEDPTTIETFRQRLVKRRDQVTLIKGQGYWWAGAELPMEVAANE